MRSQGYSTKRSMPQNCVPDETWGAMETTILRAEILASLGNTARNVSHTSGRSCVTRSRHQRIIQRCHTTFKATDSTQRDQFQCSHTTCDNTILSNGDRQASSSRTAHAQALVAKLGAAVVPRGGGRQRAGEHGRHQRRPLVRGAASRPGQVEAKK